MSAAESLTSRLDALEVRVAYQDATIEDLNATITAQWREIDRLTRHVAELKDRFEEMGSPGLPAGPEAQPPHY
jgi:SlyX protein